MDWSRYRALCDRPDVMSRWLLETTLAVLARPDSMPDCEASASPAQVAAALTALRTALRCAPLPRPADHRGPPGLDMFWLALPSEPARALVQQLEALVAKGELAVALAGRSASAFLAAWREHAAAAVTAGQRTNPAQT